MVRLAVFSFILLAFASISASRAQADSYESQEFERQSIVSAEQSDPAYENVTTEPRYVFLSNRWDREENPASENDLADNQVIQDTRKPQRDYACGRALATSKSRDLLIRDQSFLASVTRGRYRPTEIRMPRIIGGDETLPGEFPWAVSVKLNGQPICGGSLIDRNWILTAAHCVVGYNPKNLTVRLGAYRIKDTSEVQTVDLPVAMFIVHKDYSMPRPFSNDIALLKMAESVQFTDYIIPICLPIEDQVTSSTSSQVINDYSNRFELPKEATESGGIVISTKMSDNDIAKCFNKIEQNYLQSIGLGSVVSIESSTESGPSRPVKVQQAAVTPLPLPPIPVSPVAALNHLFAHDSLISNPVLNAAALLALGDKYSTANYNTPNKIKFNNQHTRPSSDMDELERDQLSMPISNARDQDKYVLFSSPWVQRSLERPAFESEAFRKRPEKVKVSKLAISKELLHEIQSVGSGPMPALNLALQQGDILAMASDLTQSSLNPNLQREKVGSQQDSKAKSNLALQTRDQSRAEVDDPVRYSGLSGTVVGWGWVRELDGDEGQANHKGYPSMTLQKVKLPILRNNVCEAWFQSQSKKITLLPSQFCAGFSSGGKDACRVSSRINKVRE